VRRRRLRFGTEARNTLAAISSYANRVSDRFGNGFDQKKIKKNVPASGFFPAMERNDVFNQ
jgi:hypothetical protein